MLSLLQRVRQARVEIDGHTIGQIDAGLLVLLCAERGDSEAVADRLLAKMLKLRIFSDAQAIAGPPQDGPTAPSGAANHTQWGAWGPDHRAR